MDIEGAGQVLIETLVDQGMVHTFADLYRLREEDLIELKLGDKRFGEKKTATLLNGLKRSRKQPLARVLAGLNIRHVGGASAELIAAHFGRMERIAGASAEDLQQVEGVGPELAQSIRSFFGSEAGRDAWQQLRDVGVNMKQPRAKRPAGLPLAGKTVVVTGTLERFTRTEIQEKIKALGGKPAGSVSSKTDLVLVGDSPGSKAEKARRLNVRVVDEETFVAEFGVDST